ncbi:type ii alternative rna polymerase sigma sigma-70 family protein [Nannochloropsis gaditana CCMP526]|uniref:type ii alternative rna polymerase sigma sigma-70 family protein n=1 Tax=Nannochloropsis gaditana (strain CCMP526) TaxID=1093141 RepID=UPI00029F7C0E|nr:type ii alternative rna polymerase sigma sigma-70 family protein [Nannochloropsis gaditana CCMP526]EKU21444.1 type ii alternative rna polymerase sigma sigma-70 family protein [Nannochloropsis gaditana CCMP526]|eukprot:XP_005854915.1 type ii alternative rna polymerase sigma sigma-70 family protein [Nannochloropsis gaditana CCMP526]
MKRPSQFGHRPLTPNPPGADGSVKTSTSIHLPAEQQLELARCVKSWLTCKAVKAEEESTLGRPIAFSEWARALGVEESALRRQIADGKAARELLVKTNINLVKSMAVRLHQSQEKNENRLSVDDLILEGTQGILKAAAKFDPTRNVRFSTYAVWWIRQAISLAIQTHSNTVRLPVLLQTRIKKIKAARLRLYLQLEREPTHEEVGREVGLPAGKVERIRRKTARGRLVGEEEEWVVAGMTVAGTEGPEEEQQQRGTGGIEGREGEAGGEVTDYVLFFKTEEAQEAMKGATQLVVGGSGGVAVGPLGRSGAWQYHWSLGKTRMA